MQSALPVVSLYLPAAQAVQEPASRPVYPALQVQLDRAVLPAGDVLDAGQARHAASSVAPALVEYLPPAQTVHARLPESSA